jgi:hypothetical protein
MEFVVHDLATALLELGHSAAVFAPRIRDLEREIDHRYQLVRFGVTWPGAFRLGFNRLLLLAAFRKLHRNRPFDVVNSHSAYFSTTYALDFRRAFGVPLVITCHGHNGQRIPEIGYGQRPDPRKDRLIRQSLAHLPLQQRPLPWRIWSPWQRDCPAL